MKKRIFSIILAGLMIISSFSAFAQESVQEERTTAPVPEYAAQLLEALGIMNSSEANMEREIQRNYAAQILLKLAKIDGGAATGAYYSDVQADSTYAYAIEKMTELGYFRGVGGGQFLPDGYIAIPDMARLLLRLAGYGVATENPSVTADIYKNSGVAGNTTYRDLAHMIFNMFRMNAMSVTELSQSGSSFAVNPNLTVMSDLFDVYEIKGTITENDLTGLWGNSTLNENEFMLKTAEGNFKLKNGKTDAGSNIGKYVRVFYQYDKDTDSLITLSYGIEKSSGVYDVNLLDFDFGASTESELKYTTEGKNQKVRYNSQTSIIYNGTYYTDAGFEFTNLSGLEGNITVIDNNSDNIADIFDITAYKTYVVKSVVLSDGRVFSKNTNEVIVLDEEEYDKFSLTYIDGKKAYLEDFVPGVVLSVAQNAKSAEKQLIKAYVEQDSVKGKVTSIYEEDGKQMIEIGDGTYQLIPDIELPDLGKSVEAYLTPFGKIAYIKTGSGTDFLFALTTNIVKNSQTREVMLKLFTTDEEFVEYAVADNVRIDGEKFKGSNKIYDKLTSFSALNVAGLKFEKGLYPVRYELNAEGKISLIDTSTVGANEDRTSSLTKIDAKDSGVLIGDLVLGGEIAVESDTPSFYVYAAFENSTITYDMVNNTDNIGCTTMGSYSPPRNFNYAAYTMNKENKYASFIITHSDTTTWDPGKDDTIFVLDKISYVYDSENDITLPRIEGYDAGVKRQAIVSAEYVETFNNMKLKQGDAIRYNTSNGKICRIEGGRPTVSHGEDGVTIRAIKDADHEFTEFTGGYSNLILIYGYVLEREDNLITIAYKSPGTFVSGTDSGTKLLGTRSDEDLAGEKLLIKVPSNVAVTVFDPTAEEEKVYAGTYDEILSYDSVGTECSLVALRFRSSKLVEVVVFNNASLYN